VHRRQQGLVDAEVPVQDLHQRGDVVGGAAGARDDLRLPVRPVDPVDDRRHIRALGRAGQHHIAGPGAQVLLGVLAPGEPAGALQHQVDLQVSPREPLGIAPAQVHQRLAVDDQLVLDGLDRPLVAPVHGIVLEQVHHVLE